MVVIGASIGLYPLEFAIFGEVGETTTKKYLKEKFNLFKSVEEVSYESATLMRALSVYTNKTTMICENLVLNYIQKNLQQQIISRKTCFTKKQYGLYNVVISEGEEIFLKKINSIDVKKMNLKWY